MTVSVEEKVLEIRWGVCVCDCGCDVCVCVIVGVMCVYVRQCACVCAVCAHTSCRPDVILGTLPA